MTILQAELYEALISAGADEPKAKAASLGVAEIIAAYPKPNELATREYIDKKIAEIEARVTERFAEHEAKTAKKFADLEARMAAKFAELEARTAERFADLEAKIGNLETKTAEKFADLEAKTAERFADLETKIAELEVKTAEKFADLHRTIWLQGIGIVTINLAAIGTAVAILSKTVP